VRQLCTSLKMLVLSQRRNGFRRIKSLLTSPNRAIIVQRLVQQVYTSPRRVDSLWKVGAYVSGDEGLENTVTNAVSIGSVMHRWSCYQTFDTLATFIRANSFAFYLRSPPHWEKKTSLTSRSVCEFKERMKQYGYANNMVLPNNRRHNLGNPDRFVSAPVYTLAQ
jgi:hypothetical protein